MTSQNSTIHDWPEFCLQAGGALIGPHALGIIKDVEAVRHLAELGVVFLLFNIGLELSLERLRQMQKYVFGLGSAQVIHPVAHPTQLRLLAVRRAQHGFHSYG